MNVEFTSSFDGLEEFVTKGTFTPHQTLTISERMGKDTVQSSTDRMSPHISTGLTTVKSDQIRLLFDIEMSAYQ